MSESSEQLIEFYKEEMVTLKGQLMEKIQHVSNQEQEIHKLAQLVTSLKENNESLSEVFSQYKQMTVEQMTQLEKRLASVSVDKADKDFQLDQLNHEMKQLRKQQDSPDEVSVSSDDHQQIRISAEVYNISPEEFQQVKKSNSRFLGLFENINKNKQQQLQTVMDNLPSSAYKILYEEELKKINDTSGKQFEMSIWQNEVMSLFIDKKRNSKKIHEKLQTYVRNSYPEQFRGKIWTFLIGNPIRISKKLYQKLLDSVPSHPLVRQELVTQINNDLTRTFSIINEFEGSEKLKDEMREILILFSIYRPDIGYVQGMTYLIFMLLIRLGKEQTFKCFINLLLQSELLRSLFQFKSGKIDAYFNVFSYFLKEHLPKVSSHFNDLNIPKQSFLVEWFYTVFTRAFNLQLSSKVWDHFLTLGDSFVFRLSLAILSIIEVELLQQEFEDTLLLIRNCSFQISDNELFKAISRFKIDNKMLQARLLIEN